MPLTHCRCVTRSFLVVGPALAYASPHKARLGMHMTCLDESLETSNHRISGAGKNDDLIFRKENELFNIDLIVIQGQVRTEDRGQD